MVDISRSPDVKRKKKIRRIIYGAISLLVIILITVGVSRLKPAAPSVDRATVWIDTVQRGPLLRQVRGSGTLVPEDIRWIPAATSGRVEQIIVKAGTEVKADTVILELSNPTLRQELQDAEFRVRSGEATLTNLQVQLETSHLQQEASTATIEADYKKASLQA